MLRPKDIISNLSAKQLSNCTDDLSLPAVPEESPLRWLCAAVFHVEPKDTTVEMFNTAAGLMCIEWGKRYKVLQNWVNDGAEST